MREYVCALLTLEVCGNFLHNKSKQIQYSSKTKGRYRGPHFLDEALGLGEAICPESGPSLVSDHTHLHLGLRNYLSQEVLDAEKPNLFPHGIMVLICCRFFLSKSETWVSSLIPLDDWGLQLALGTRLYALLRYFRNCSEIQKIK